MISKKGIQMFVVNKDAWHYRWLMFIEKAKYNYLERKSDYEDFSGYMDWYKPTNFCEYWRRVLLWPMINFFLVLLTVGLLVVIVSIGYSSAGLWYLLQIFGTLGYVAGVFAVLIFLFMGTVEVKDRIKRSAHKNKENNIFFSTYFSIKNKICPLLKYEVKEDEK